MWNTNSNKKEIWLSFLAIAIISSFSAFVVDMKSTDSAIKTSSYSDFLNLSLVIISIILFFIGYYVGKGNRKKLANELTSKMTHVINASNQVLEKSENVVDDNSNVENKESKVEKDDLSKGVKLDR